MRLLLVTPLFHPICHLDFITGDKQKGFFCSKCAGGLYLYILRCFSNGDTRCKSHLDRVCTQVALLHLDRRPPSSFHRQNAAKNNRFPKGNSLRKKQTGNTEYTKQQEWNTLGFFSPKAWKSWSLLPDTTVYGLNFLPDVHSWDKPSRNIFLEANSSRYLFLFKKCKFLWTNLRVCMMEALKCGLKLW